MVQALAFAEIFLGLILADAGYKGVTLSQVVKGEAGSTVAPNPLGTTAAGSTASTPGGAETVPAGGAVAMTPREAARNKAFGPSPLNSPPAETATTGEREFGGFGALSPEEKKRALAEGATG
jgi:hypothetical protein